MAKRYPDGIYFNRPSNNAPSFVIGKIAISRDKFLEWLKGEEANEKGYINLDVLDGKEGKPYCQVNDFVSKGGQKPEENDPFPD